MSSRDAYLRRVYGITLEQYNELLDRQGGGCAICGKTPKEEGRSLAVEHDHVSGFIRGVCCLYCNKYLIGRHRDSGLLIKIADYVDQHTGWKVPTKKKKKRKKKKK